MKKTIFWSLCATAFSVITLLMCLITAIYYNYSTSAQRRGMRMQTELIAKAVEDEGVAFFDRMEDEDYRVTYINPEGDVIYDSQEGTELLGNHLDREEVKEAVSKGYGESYRYSSTLLEKRNYSAKRLADGSIIRLTSGHFTVLSLILAMLPFLLLICGVVIVLATVLASRLSDSIVKPLNALDLDRPAENDAYEELHPLLDRLATQQEELERTEQIRREFTANVSHELKTPLHTISGYAELLKDGIVKEQDVSHFAGRIYGEARRMTALVEDILQLSHLDEGGLDIPWDHADLYDIAKKTIDLLRQEAREANVTIFLDGEHASLFCYPSLLERIIYNLCDNAIKYNREYGTVHVHVEKKDQGVELSVKDTGIGIPPADHDRIFERFYRVDKSHSKAVGGTGLGLSIVKHAVRLQEGRLMIESEMGQGTTITVYFPDKSEKKSPHPEGESLSGRGDLPLCGPEADGIEFMKGADDE